MRYRWLRWHLPFHGLVDNGTINHEIVVFTEAVGLILDAAHHHGLIAGVTQSTYTGRSYADNSTFGYREYLTIDLILPLTAEDEIDLFMFFVSVEERSIFVSGQLLNGKLCTG